MNKEKETVLKVLSWMNKEIYDCRKNLKKEKLTKEEENSFLYGLIKPYEEFKKSIIQNKRITVEELNEWEKDINFCLEWDDFMKQHT